MVFSYSETLAYQSNGNTCMCTNACKYKMHEIHTHS